MTDIHESAVSFNFSLNIFNSTEHCVLSAVMYSKSQYRETVRGLDVDPLRAASNPDFSLMFVGRS